MDDRGFDMATAHQMAMAAARVWQARIDQAKRPN